jgi:hypothetical protein
MTASTCADPSALAARHAQLEARALVGEAYDAAVLEPSPPAVADEWFADDPASVRPDGRRPLISPVPGGDLRWDDWLDDHPEHRDWAAARWLGAHRRLTAPVDPGTRLALHRLAVYVITPARHRVNGKIGLRFAFGGIGTPFFGADEQVRLAVTHLVRQHKGEARAEPVTTLSAAADLVLEGPPDTGWAEGFEVPALGDPDAPLDVDPAAAAAFGDWVGFAWSVLEMLRSEPESVEAGRVQLWPEHFDSAFDCLSQAEHRRATFGASPGDAAVAEPYFYVLPWQLDEGCDGPAGLWNATSFAGAILPFSDFVDADDQRRAVLDFFRTRRAHLASI